MKIGLVTDFYYPWIGGPAALLQNLALGLAARGNEVQLLAPSPDGPARDEVDGPVRIHRVPTVPVPFGYKLRCAPFAARTVSDWLDRFQPEVLHVHHPFPLSAAALLAARRRHIPVVATNHTIPECSLFGLRRMPVVYPAAEAAFSWWLRHLLKRCDQVATPTATAARLLAARGYPRGVTVISNGVDTQRFFPGQLDGRLRAELGVDERLVVLYTGRLDAEKQMDVWLKAARQLARSVDVQLVVGGQGADRKRLESMAIDLAIADRVRFIGYLSDERFPELYRLAAVYFITSPVELQSITTLEAIASGLPVVAVRAGALPELVHHGRNGYLVGAGDWREAAGRLEEIVTDASKRGKMGSESREIARAHEITVTIDRYENLLVSAINEKRGERAGEPVCAPGR